MLGARSRLAPVGALVALLGVATTPVRADNKYLEVPSPAEAISSPAYRYANMTDDQALAEATRRGIQFTRAVPPARGVRVPIRLTAPLHGVTIHSTLPAEQRADTPFEIMDVRLALSLDDFCRILETHDIVEVIHFTIYRPPQTLPADPAAPQTRHPAGLAIDVGAMKKRDGQWIAVGPHWPAAIGAKTCGPHGRRLFLPRGRELMSIVCEAADARIFHYMLTPHFDGAHSDHLHLEIKPLVRWFLVN
jgi:hypothetical protein